MERFLIWAALVLVLVLTNSFNYFFAKEQGLKEGIEAYHQQCLVGGYIIDNKGNTVVCAPLSKLPKEEQNAYKLHS